MPLPSVRPVGAAPELPGTSLRAAAAPRTRRRRRPRWRRRHDPSWASTIPATMASPSPAPPRPCLRPPSARQKRSKIASASSVGSPGPWSRTSRSTEPFSRATDTSIGVPAGVCTSALRSRLASTWRSWWASPITGARSLSSEISRSGAVARASSTASPASPERSSSACGASAISSSRASVSRSSTSTPIRAASSSMRRIAFSVSSGSPRGAHPEQLGVAADRRQRRAQLVRGVGDERAQPVLGRLAAGERLLEPVEHPVERDPEPADLGAAVGRLDAVGEVAARDPPGGVAHAVEREQRGAHHRPAGHDQHEQHGGDHEREHHEQPLELLRWPRCSGTATTRVPPANRSGCASTR